MADQPKLLRIKKYSNRRFYDTTRSCHLTLAELNELVVAGHDVRITDSKTSDDITNAVLMHLIVERHAGKLALFPTVVLHQLIRTQEQFAGRFFEQLFGPALAAQRSAQERWQEWMRNALASNPFMPQGPANWQPPWMQGFGSTTPDSGATPESTSPDPDAPGAAARSTDKGPDSTQQPNRRTDAAGRSAPETPQPRSDAPTSHPSADRAELDALRNQLAALAEEVNRLRGTGGN